MNCKVLQQRSGLVSGRFTAKVHKMNCKVSQQRSGLVSGWMLHRKSFTKWIAKFRSKGWVLSVDASPQKFHKMNCKVSQQRSGLVSGGRVTAKVSQNDLQSFAAKVRSCQWMLHRKKNFYVETQSVGIHAILTLLSFTMHHWAIVKAHLYIRFQLSEQFVWGYVYVECIAAKQNMSSCISCYLNMVRSKSNWWTRSSREKATTFFVFGYHVRPYDKIGRKISKFGGTMSDHRLLLPALLQDGTLISIHTLKWLTVS